MGNLSTHSRREDIEKLFYQYGKVTVLGRSGPGPHPRFTFVEFEDPRDAEDAVCTWDGYIYNGRRLKVEREIRGHKGRKSQHKATQPGGKIQRSLSQGDTAALMAPLPPKVHPRPSSSLSLRTT